MTESSDANKATNGMAAQPASVEKVRSALKLANIDTEIVHHPEGSRTAEDAARACGCQVGQIIKSLIFAGKTSGKPVLLLVAGDNRVHEKRVGRAIGEPIVRASVELVRQATGYAIGGVSPVGHPAPIDTYADETLTRFDSVWAAAGTPNHVFSVAPNELFAATNAKLISVL